MESTQSRSKMTMALGLTLWIGLINVGPLASQTAKPRKPAGAIKAAISPVPAAFRLPAWVASGPPRKFRKDKLSDYLGPEAEIILEYGFIDLAVHRFRPAERVRTNPRKEMVLEVYRMETPDDAFGIFSIRRTGAEGVSGVVGAMNRVGAAGAELIKGNCYLRLLATGCAELENEKVAAAAIRQIKLPEANPPAGIAWLPKTDMITRSERYICGRAAARKESPLLGNAVWGFGTGGCRAYVARYAPKDSKLVLLDFGRKIEDMTGAVTSLFREYLENVRKEGSTVLGEDAAGSTFIFGQSEKTAALVLGEPDREAARSRLADALSNAAGRGES
jgi:hypothetical protein